MSTALSFENSNYTQVWTVADITQSAQRQAVTASAQSDVFQTVMKWLNIVVGALGMCNNLTVILVVLSVKKLRLRSRNWFILHQSLADFFSAIFIINLTTKTVTSVGFYGVVGQGFGGFLACSLWMSNFLYNTSSLASTYILAAFTIEVYVAIVHPVFHKNYFNRKLVAVMVAGAWAIGIGYCMGMSMGIARVINGVCYSTYGWPPIALGGSFAAFLLRMILPILCYAICYILIFVSLRNRARVIATRSVFKVTANQKGNSKTQPQSSNIASTSSQKQYSRASQNVVSTVLFTIIIHVAAWSGNQVIIFMTAFNYVTNFSAPLFQVFLLATYCTSCVNPFVYVVKYKELRSAVHRMLFCKSNHSFDAGIMLTASSNNGSATATT